MFSETLLNQLLSRYKTWLETVLLQIEASVQVMSPIDKVVAFPYDIPLAEFNGFIS